jgi:hypothetical protein
MASELPHHGATCEAEIYGLRIARNVDQVPIIAADERAFHPQPRASKHFVF